ncbi:MAG: SDR family oxidoreductase [Ruminococcus sp.]|nr:SDR family oxidoreductase [Ruminococcus sp.]
MKTAFVTGGSGGIGKAVCLRLAAMGYAVAVGYNTNKTTADIVTELIRQRGGTAMSIKCDVTEIDSIDSAKNVISAQLSSPTVLVCSAGAADIALFSEQSYGKIKRLIDTDLTGAVMTARAFVPSMISRHEGCVLLISSVWGEQGASCEAVYSAAKAGVIGFAKALGKELAPSGVRVNCISPGFIDTKMNASVSPEARAAFLEDVPMGRAGTADEVAAAAAFLVSDEAAYITAQNISVNGGL